VCVGLLLLILVRVRQGPFELHSNKFHIKVSRKCYVKILTS